MRKAFPIRIAAAATALLLLLPALSHAAPPGTRPEASTNAQSATASFIANPRKETPPEEIRQRWLLGGLIVILAVGGVIYMMRRRSKPVAAPAPARR
jgi:hypothetical protein